MPDTIRVLDDFVNVSTGLLKDNTIGDISAQDSRDLAVSADYWAQRSLILDAEYNAGLGNVAKTLILGKLTPIDLGANNGGNLAANVVITLPSTGLTDGDRCGFFVSRKSDQAGSFAQAPGYAAELANATDVNGAAYTSAATGSGKWGLWLPGEMLIFRYCGTGFGDGVATWFVEFDGRILHAVYAYRNTDETGLTINQWNTVSLDSVLLDTALMFKSATYSLQIKRAGLYTAASAIYCTGTSSQRASISNAIVNGAVYYRLGVVSSEVGNAQASGAVTISVAANDAILLRSYFGDTTGTFKHVGVASSNYHVNISMSEIRS